MNIRINFSENGTVVHTAVYNLDFPLEYSKLSEFIQSLTPSTRGFKIIIYYIDASNESFEYIDEIPDDLEKKYISKEPIKIDVFPGTEIKFKINWQGTFPYHLLLKLDKPTISQLMEFIDTEYRSSNSRITSKHILHLKLTRGGKITVFKKDNLRSADQEYRDGDEFEISYVNPTDLKDIFKPSSTFYPPNIHEFSFGLDTPASDHFQLEAAQYADEMEGAAIRARLGANMQSILNEEDRAKFTRVVASLTIEECRILARILTDYSETAAGFLPGIYTELNHLPEDEILTNLQELIARMGARMGGKRTKRKRDKRTKRAKRKRTKRAK
jgi:hypothetical protein